ncbi:MAG: hypothetical protein ACKORL_13485, partial [Phycisphaerales bacterium]
MLEDTSHPRRITVVTNDRAVQRARPSAACRRSRAPPGDGPSGWRP